MVPSGEYLKVLKKTEAISSVSNYSLNRSITYQLHPSSETRKASYARLYSTSSIAPRSCCADRKYPTWDQVDTGKWFILPIREINGKLL